MKLQDFSLFLSLVCSLIDSLMTIFLRYKVVCYRKLILV